MAFHARRLHRALSLSYSVLEHSFHGCKAKPVSSSASRLLPAPAAAAQLTRRPFTSTTALLRRPFNPETDEIKPDTILFEGCDYNHWLITVDFPKDTQIPREQMIETYVNIAAQVFGSVEEAKKRIYALSTTTYQGFQVECSEATSEKFKNIPSVVFVLPDSYLDPVNKEYGGDKYVNGEIFPRPPPIHHGRSNRDTRPRQQNYGPPPQQNYGPPPQQNYGRPPPQQNYGPPPQQNYGPPPQQNYGPPPQQNYGRPPPQQGYTPQPNQRPNPQGSYGNSPNFPPHPNITPAGPGERNSMPPYQGNFNRAGAETGLPVGQGNFQSYAPPGQRGFPQDATYESSQDGAHGQVPGGRRNFSTSENH